MNKSVASRLVVRGQELFRRTTGVPPFAGDPLADALVQDITGNPHAFVIACIADRQVKAETAWRLPYELGRRVGGSAFAHLRSLSPDRLHRAVAEVPALHRYPERMSASISKALRRIEAEFGGDAAKIWLGKPSSAEVVLRFLMFDGVGPKIATMATNILARDFKVPMADYSSVDVSVDVHLRRVFGRLGLIRAKATVEEVVYAARALHPEFPGLMDFPAWEIGREWCRPQSPICSDCFMRDVCPTAVSGGAL